MIFCSNASNPAKRRYLRGVAVVMTSYMGLVMLSRILIRGWHLSDWHLYVAAALPSIPLLCLAYIVGRYLTEERDEYQRDVVVRGLLWGTAVTLSLSVFTSFLHAYGWRGDLPAFTEVVLFWVTAAVAKLFYHLTNRSADEEPAA